MELPLDNAEYRRIAKELIEKRQFTPRNKDGTPLKNPIGDDVVINIDNIDEEIAKQNPQDQKKTEEDLGAKF